MTKQIQKLLAVFLAVTIFLAVIPFGTFTASALESTGNATFDAFINDSRWTHGISWGNQTPKLNPSAGYSQCAAYCYDFVAYCFDIYNPRGGQVFYSASEIRAGDVITVGNPSNGNGHWFAVLKRSGNSLYVAEGNYAGKVRIGWNYSVNGSSVTGTSYGFTAGYHFLDGEPSVPQGSEMTSGYDRILPDGDYIIANAGSPDKSNFYYLDIPGVDYPATNETNVQIWGPLTSINSQDIWTFKYNDGFYSIKQKGTNMALDVYGSSKAQGANVQVYQSNTSSGQKWAISHNDRNGYRIQAKCSGMSLDVNGGGTVAGTNIQQWTNNDSDAQSWLFIPYNPTQPIANGRYVISSALDSNKIVSTDFSEDIQNIFISSKGENIGDSVFEITKLDNGYYKVIHCNSGKVLTVSGGFSTVNTNVALSVDNNTIAKQWAIIAYNGKYKIISRCNGYALDITKASTSDGTNIAMYRRHTNSNQQWSFEPAEVTVKFDANGGSSVSNVKVIYGNNLSALPQTSRDGYTFLGWYTSKEGGTKLTTSTKIVSNITYYAHWYNPCENGEHSWGSWAVTTAATCTENGAKTRICIQCGNTETDIVPATGHKVSDWIIDREAQIGIAGSKHKECAVCHTVLETEEIPALVIIDENAPQIVVDSVKASAGKTVSVNVSLKNNPGITSAKFKVYFPEDLTLTNVTFGDIGGQAMTSALTSPVTINWFNGLDDLKVKDTVFATLTFQVDGNATVGKKDIRVVYDPDDVYNIADSNVEFAAVNGGVEVIAYVPGDINNDEKLNNKDLTRLFQYLSDWDVEVNEAALDINGDGKVNNRDLTRLFQYLSDWDVEIF